MFGIFKEPRSRPSSKHVKHFDLLSSLLLLEQTPQTCAINMHIYGTTSLFVVRQPSACILYVVCCAVCATWSWLFDLRKRLLTPSSFRIRMSSKDKHGDDKQELGQTRRYLLLFVEMCFMLICTEKENKRLLAGTF